MESRLSFFQSVLRLIPSSRAARARFPFARRNAERIWSFSASSRTALSGFSAGTGAGLRDRVDALPLPMPPHPLQKQGQPDQSGRAVLFQAQQPHPLPERFPADAEDFRRALALTAHAAQDLAKILPLGLPDRIPKGAGTVVARSR